MPVHANPTTILLATLGSEAQVVSAALDLLEREGERIAEARVLHTVAPAGSPIQNAIERLEEAFAAPPYRGRVPLRLLPMCDDEGRSLEDVATPRQTRAAFRFVYAAVRQTKREGYRLHLALSGGRKTLALFAMAAAQLLCDEGDHLWYLHSGGEFLESKHLHPSVGDDAHLIEVPFILWSRLSPAFLSLEALDDPFEAAGRARQLQLGDRLEAARAFVLGALTPAERRCVALLVHEGLSDQQIAERLTISNRTVESHLRSAYAKAAAHWELEEVGRAGLVALLNLYFTLQE